MVEKALGRVKNFEPYEVKTRIQKNVLIGALEKMQVPQTYIELSDQILIIRNDDVVFRLIRCRLAHDCDAYRDDV